VFSELGDLRVEIRWVDPPEAVPRPRVQDPDMVQTMVGTSIVLGMFAALLTLMWEKEPPRPPLALSPDRITKIEAPEALEFQKKEVAKHEKEKAEEKSKEKEGQTKRAKDKAGKLGRTDATQKDTIIPKGKEDILREKVQKIGILSIIGKDKAPGSGLSKLFAQNNDVEQAVAGMAGAKLAVGRGAGGLSTSGSGPGGGGTGYGHIYGAGNLDTGGHGNKGHGRGPKLAERGEHEVSVGMGNGGGDTDGSLSKEQIMKVVKAHMAGVKYCYEKELQHKTSLAGGVDIFWLILPDGTVQKASLKGSTMSDPAVEGCILRQVKQWQFPKAPGQTIVTRFPFVFKGG
jgi:outer membrane biosynthesis protein TonB